jgi:hypothetical protein
VKDDNMGQCSRGVDSDSDNDYKQSVASDSANGGDEHITETQSEEGIRMDGMSMKFVWQGTSMLLQYGKYFVVTMACS